MDTKRKVSVILNGQIPINNTLINQINNSDYIIAVDGSANKLFDLEIIPDVIIGDLDSFQNISDKNIELVETPDQNKTDFRKTLEWCIEKNILDISIFGISNLKPGIVLKCEINSGESKSINLRCRIDTSKELEYYKAGGILNYVLNEIISEAA